MRSPRIKRKRAVLAILVLALATASAAIAAWITWTMSGNGGSRFGTPAAATLVFTANSGVVGSPVTAGGAGDIGFDVVNSATAPAHVLTLTIPSTPTSTSCTLAPGDLTINAAAVTAANLLVPTGSTTGLKIPGALQGAASLPIACAGGTITIPLAGTAGP